MPGPSGLDSGVQRMSETEEKPRDWWRKVYVAVVITTVLVIASLGAFTWYFSR